ncbi:DUF1214 domain-containing protein [Streptomyces sp. NPDC005899]|uniref:DUF1214 domain-containing protein n=1 Tax=Streptomyces sp. NPDC005899 TaxID=3155716 RepID=UPI0033C13719
MYADTSRDSRGRPLDGSHGYVLRLAEPPPVRAFGSLTVYADPGGRLVGDETGRRTIGDRTPGLVRAADGSLTLHLSAGPPADPVAAANWLPLPAGGFRPLLRMHQPDQRVLDGSYVIPPIERLRDGRGA